MSDEKTKWLPIICIGFIAIVFAYILVNTESTPSAVPASNSEPLVTRSKPSYPDGQFDCSLYQNDLHKIANTPDDLIETHRATGVIKQVDEDEKYYVIVINPNLWKQTTAEQRQLIRCSTTEIAKSKGKEGGIVDPIRYERIY